MASSLTIIERPGLGIATVMARKGVDPASLEVALGFMPPDGPTRVEHDGLAMIGTGPAAWLAMTETPEVDWPASLERKLTGLASISDQSGSYAIFRIAGENARVLLQRGAFLDLHADRFRTGSTATTVIAHIGVVFWCIDDNTFDIATFRSYGPSLSRWITTTAASF